MNKSASTFLGSVVAVILILLSSTPTMVQSQGWWNSSWINCKSINVTGGDSNLTDFPVFLTITYDSDMQSDFEDIRLVNASCSNNGSELKYEIERSIEGQEAYVWVKIPLLAAGVNQISMYYGNPSAGSGEDAASVWSDNFIIVQHLEETSGTFYDSTSFDNNGTGSSVTYNVSGEFDGATGFDGSNSYISIPHTSEQVSASWTIEAWFNTTTFYAGGSGVGVGSAIFDKTHPGGAYYRRLSVLDHNGTRCISVIYSIGVGNYWIYSDTNLSTNEWYHGAVTFDGDRVFRVYVDGVLENTTTVGSTPDTTTDVITIGYRPTAIPTEYFNGTLDEVRLSNVTRSTDWIIRSYQNSNSSYISWGVKESYRILNLSSGWNLIGLPLVFS